jgi:flagellar biosynthesis protein FliQ
MIRATVAAILWTSVAVCLLVTLFQAATDPKNMDIVPLGLCWFGMMVFTLASGRSKSR